jgi:hypothetical protein
MKKILLVLVVLLMASTAWLYLQYQRNVQAVYDLEANNSNLKYNFDGIRTNFFERYNLENTIVRDTLLDDENKNILLKDHLKKSYKLIFRFDDSSCNPCIQRELHNIADLEKVVGHDKILIIAGYEDHRKIQVILNNLNIKSKLLCISRNQKLTKFDKGYIVPYLFTLNTDMRITKMFIPLEKDDDLSAKYFEFIKMSI